MKSPKQQALEYLITYKDIVETYEDGMKVMEKSIDIAVSTTQKQTAEKMIGIFKDCFVLDGDWDDLEIAVRKEIKKEFLR